VVEGLDVAAFVDDGLGHSSYLVDLGDGTALVVDPHRIPERELADATARGLRIAYTLDTHSHADFVSGSPELVARGAEFLAPASGHLQVAHRGLHDGDRVDVGTWALEAIATPGHTPDHLAYLVETRDGTPVALFSGGSLMVDTIGRTDLLGPEHAEALAHAQFHSVRDRVLALPDDLAVYPTHGAGSFCSAPGGTDRVTTIGQERAHNPLLQIDDETAFVDALLAGFGSFPSFFSRLPEVNRRGPRVYGEMPDLTRLDLDTFRAALESGAQLVDARPIDRYAAGHIPGSWSIELRPVFATWLGWLVDPSLPVVFVLDDDQDRHDLVRQCLTVGVERLAGELAGGVPTWRDAGLPLTSVALITVAELEDRTLLDVRQRDEFVSSHVPAARNVELGALADADAIPSGPLAVMCGHGERAMTGASLLERAGRDDLAVVRGGPEDWAASTGQALTAGP
jgi:glyoxylase-like metal-dependent hydrolase (beta-lactamase superfamily II)/rhodanese-related sulfurtransferase